MKCETKQCADRHPKVCKWLESASGCKRGEDCDFLHVTLVRDEGIDSERKIADHHCISCKSIFPDSSYVKRHVIGHKETFFCLNCDDWVKKKTMVYNPGWTLVDNNGFLRRGI